MKYTFKSTDQGGYNGVSYLSGDIQVNQAVYDPVNIGWNQYSSTSPAHTITQWQVANTPTRPYQQGDLNLWDYSAEIILGTGTETKPRNFTLNTIIKVK